MEYKNISNFEGEKVALHAALWPLIYSVIWKCTDKLGNFQEISQEILIHLGHYLEDIVLC